MKLDSNLLSYLDTEIISLAPNKVLLISYILKPAYYKPYNITGPQTKCALGNKISKRKKKKRMAARGGTSQKLSL